MAKRWITRQAQAEAARNVAMAGRIAAMRMDRTANQSGWERLATRSWIVRAEIADRKMVVAA